MEDMLRTTARTTPRGQLQRGDVFVGYRIERLLGAGGMGAVYLAQHPRLPRRVALKLLNDSLCADDRFRARFEREADLASGLDHRNIVAVYDRGQHEGQLWISMRYLAGTDAARLLSTVPAGLPPATAVRIVTEVGHGLDYAHRHGLVHRDVKPANILIADANGDDETEILLTDFGIARALDDVVRLTDTGSLLATVHYAAPEHLEGNRVDGRADVYALGCTLYELLTGRYPFPLANPLAIINAHLHSDPPRPTMADPAVPAEFDAVVARALAKRPDERYATCAELSAAAQRALAAPSRANPTRAATTLARVQPPPPAWPAQPRPAQPRPARSAPSHPARPAQPPPTRSVAPPERPPGAQVGPPAPAAPSRRPGRRRLLLSTAALASLGAVAGGVALFGGLGFGATEWTSAAPVVAQFPRLLPERPEDTGFHDARCHQLTRAGATGVSCTDASNVTFEVWRTDDQATRDALTAPLRVDPSTQPMWSEGTVLASADSVPDGWVLTEFADAARSPYLIAARWPGHSAKDLIASWWNAAPF